MLDDVKRNWKTTLLGVLVILVVAAYLVQCILDHKPIDLTTILGSLGGLAGGAGLIVSKDGDKTGTVVMPRGFARPRSLLALVFACGILLAACAALKQSSVTATVSGKKADVVVTAPDGSSYGVLVENHQACAQGNAVPYVRLPASTLECQPACGALVQGGAVVTVNCRVVGGSQIFPISFAIPFKT